MNEPNSVTGRFYAIYAPSIPPQRKDQFLAILDAAPCGTPNAQWIMDALDDLDALIDPYNPLPDEARKARGAIRLAAMEILMKLLSKRMRQDSPL